jgi:hypothetical protein
MTPQQPPISPPAERLGPYLQNDGSPTLIGRDNPRTCKPYGKTSHEGPNTRDVREAAKLRDIHLGQIRAEESALNGAASTRGTITSAKGWAAARRDGRIKPREYETEAYDEARGKHLQITAIETIEDDLILDEAEELVKTQGDDAASHWLRVARGETLAFAKAIDAYIENTDISPNPHEIISKLSGDALLSSLATM